MNEVSHYPLLLRAERIDKSFPGVHALENVDFDLEEGRSISFSARTARGNRH